MHKELVLSKKMTNRAFHDAILKSNRIPVELIHADLTNQKLARDYTTSWKFYGPIPAAGHADGARLTTAGFGGTKPVAPNVDEAGRTQNRRVELVKK